MGSPPKTSYGCRFCTAAACFKGDASRMPKTCPTLTQPKAKDVSRYRIPIATN